ncbi:PH domain-containing protein [Rossellomorea marisflavi]|uniref:PH domain-containing protein n=1 Tax=Rossellomorea marisflavi TaxID=189381 RepID=UPI0034583255
MSGIQRFHPAFLAVELVSFAKGIFFVYFFLFILKAQSSSSWVVWGRYILIAWTVWAIVNIILKWISHGYEVTDRTIVIHEGIVVKTRRTAALDRIHNQTSNTTFVHKWFGLTSLKLETGTSGNHGEVEFPVITLKEKDRILSLIGLQQRENAQVSGDVPLEEEAVRTVHFQSNKKDLIRASFTSLSFLAIFPLLSAAYSNLAVFFNLEDGAEGAWDYLVLHWWMLIILFIIALLLSSIIGYGRMYLKYGKFTISDDHDKIYIEKGVANVTHFSIPKRKIQAVVVEQSILKRLVGLASVKLISAGSSELESEETSSLYPFLPKHEAYRIIQEMLPHYEIKEEMGRFPQNVLWAKLLRPYYVTILSIAGFIMFKPSLLWISAILFLLSLILRVLDYTFTSYIRHGELIQIRSGAITTETFVTHKRRIQQATVTHSWLQRRFGIATLSFTNRADPTHVSELYGVSNQEAGEFYDWYRQKSASS